MKTLNQDEIELLGTIVKDIDITIDSKFSSVGETVARELHALVPVFVGLYLKSVNHDPKNRSWKNRDYIFPLNNYTNLVKNLVELHVGYGDFNKIEDYLREYSFGKVENTLSHAIGHYVASRDASDKHERYYYVVCSELDILSNLSLLDYIIKNKMKRIIITTYTRSSNENINKENKLNGRLINLGFDTLVTSVTEPENMCNAISYAKKLDKPSVILANIN